MAYSSSLPIRRSISSPIGRSTWIVSALLTVVPICAGFDPWPEHGHRLSGRHPDRGPNQGAPGRSRRHPQQSDQSGSLARCRFRNLARRTPCSFASPRSRPSKSSSNPSPRSSSALGDTVEYRRVEIVGPTISGELVASGTLAVVMALIGILIYVWFRFEWQFGVAAIASLIHDVTGHDRALFAAPARIQCLEHRCDPHRHRLFAQRQGRDLRPGA